ncbi:hypothetical protein BD770DRAFT_436392 [Pilaira anomala]|nr:hypothetical protein BD770DRAFT_436392 [Pilaira anomala]
MLGFHHPIGICVKDISRILLQKKKSFVPRSKKLTLYAILCIAIILFVGQSSAIVRTEEEADWTRDSLGSYFSNKYQQGFHDKNADDQNSLAEIRREYKDSLISNSRIFGSGVDRLVSGFTDTLNKHRGSPDNDLDPFITNLKYKLRELELKGQLSKERVQAVLDSAYHHAMRHKILTEDEWDEAYDTFTNIYQQPSWYQRVLSLKPNVEEGASAFNNWIQSVMGHLGHVGGLTKEQTKAIADQLRTSVSDTDFSRLGDKNWVDDLTRTLSRKTDLKKDQLEKIVASIARDVNGYRYFALDYTGKGREHAQNWCDQVKTGVDGFWDRLHSQMGRWKSIVLGNSYRDHPSHYQHPSDREYLSHHDHHHHHHSDNKHPHHDFDHHDHSAHHDRPSHHDRLSYHDRHSHHHDHEHAKIHPHRVADSVKSVAHSISEDWEASSHSIVRSRSTESIKSKVSSAASHVTSAAAHATSKISDFDLDQLKNIDLKDSFAHFWRSKEHDVYRKLGYTEAHINWIQDYLTKTFKNQKSSVHTKSDEAVIAIKRYLNAVHVQNPTQVDATVHRLKRLLESWRTLVN